MLSSIIILATFLSGNAFALPAVDGLVSLPPSSQNKITGTHTKKANQLSPQLQTSRACTQMSVTIKTGDTLNAIAKTAGVGICNIAAVNQITNTDMIYAGQTLSFGGPRCETANNGPTCVVVAASPVIRAAVAGDTFFNMAVKAGTTVALIQAANPLVVATNIKIGTLITIP